MNRVHMLIRFTGVINIQDDKTNNIKNSKFDNKISSSKKKR